MGLPYIHITVDMANVNYPLRQIYVGQGSAMNLRISGFDTERFTAAVLIHPLVEGATAARFDAALDETTGFLMCHISGWGLTVDGTTDYEILIFDSDSTNEAYWTGRGKLVIRKALQVAEIPGAPVVTPPQGYVQHPVTHLWHKVVAELNDLNQIVLTTSEEGVEHV